MKHWHKLMINGEITRRVVGHSHKNGHKRHYHKLNNLYGYGKHRDTVSLK